MSLRKLQRAMDRRARADGLNRIAACPKPPVIDGVCACGCCHVPDHGACPKYYNGANSRCAVCDHSILCHRRKGEAPPKDWNFPVKTPENWERLLPSGWRNKIRGVICGHCEAPAMHCPTCQTPIPIKECVVIEKLHHVGTCPKCGGVDVECPGIPEPKEANESTPTPDRPADAADPAAPVD